MRHSSSTTMKPRSSSWIPASSANRPSVTIIRTILVTTAEVAATDAPRRSRLMTAALACNASHVFWNRRYEPAIIERDTKIKATLRDHGITAWSGNAGLIWEPHEVQNKSGEPFRVFTPFWRHLRTLTPSPPIVTTSSM